MPKVSVIIPTYNRCQLLPRAVKSAQQAGTDVEVIVVDDASTDDTPKVCRALVGIRYFRMERNGGQAAARNAGIQVSTAEYVAFLDDDDIRLPGSVDRQAALLLAEPNAALVYGQVIYTEFPEQCLAGAIFPQDCPQGDVFWALLTRNFIAASSVIVRRSSCLRVGLFEPAFTGAEDWEMWIRLAEQFPVAAIAEPVTRYRYASRTSGQFTSNLSAMMRVTNRVQQRGLQLPRAKAALPIQRKQVRKNFLDWAAEALICEVADALTEGAGNIAYQNLCTAFQLNPLFTGHPQTIYALLASIIRRGIDARKKRERTTVVEKIAS